jgi:hypothetical protein
MKLSLGRLGASFYVVWGLLHLKAAYGVYLLTQTLQAGMTQGRLLQSAWNLAALALTAIAVAIWLNWKSDKIGYWVNLVTISVTDVGFILFILVPGYVPLIPGIAGPIFWILGGIFTTMSYQSNQQSARK